MEIGSGGLDMKNFFQTNSFKVCGVDEVGRGPWAGPVIAAAVILPDDFSHIDLRDSKKMTLKARIKSDIEIRECAIFAFGAASVREIDSINIRMATHLAMKRAVLNLSQIPTHIDVDGRDVPVDLPSPATAIIKGDATHPHIAAASIIAKQLRDRLMTALAARHPHYGWETNAGYGTKAHQNGLAQNGICAHHRVSFKPIAALE